MDMEHPPHATIAPQLNTDDDVNRYAVLAKLPSDQLVDIKALAKCMACSPRTILRRVNSFQLPPPIRLGNQSIWIVGRIKDWLDKNCKKAEAIANQEVSRLSDYEFRT